MMTPELKIYRRKLPHWRMDGTVYFVTWRLAKHQPPLAPDERTAVVGAIDYFESQRYKFATYVVMDDHVHVLLLPFDDFELHQIVHSWKSFSAQRLAREWARTRPIWQREYFDRIVRDDEEFTQKAQYILGNPLKRWPDLEEYPWVGLGAFF
jgi:putative transposase